MEDSREFVSRRTVLRTTGAALALPTVSGFAAASPDEFVEVNVGYDGRDARKTILDTGHEVVREFNFDALTIRVPKRAAEALARNPKIRYVEENGRMRALGQQTTWNIDRVNADRTYHCGYDGSGADVAIIDTGIDDDHPDLRANLGSGAGFVTCGSSCSYGGNDNACNQSWSDDNDHGTHCAGIAGAAYDSQGVYGVASGATLHAVKVLSCSGSGSYSDIAAGVEYVADQGWDVGSMSLGGSSGSQALHDAIRYAYDNGVLLVAAASGSCSTCVGYPAEYSEVISVGATDKSDAVSSSSTTSAEIYAPGSDIYSTVPGGYATFSGSSMSAPHVAAAGGILMAQRGFSHQSARTRLTSTAGSVSGCSSCKLLDVAAAVDC
ncbi:S8 family serine peptidase [Haladaptatus salinisoli]|uniref:S8 family serine peptidase n=1 Tax=Haladaptatus salinisoli TaxID=2884876 RepID=UPI001D0AA655|nr:S8 family serine peptidase [Haladaptatus salinisoli]